MRQARHLPAVTLRHFPDVGVQRHLYQRLCLRLRQLEDLYFLPRLRVHFHGESFFRQPYQVREPQAGERLRDGQVPGKAHPARIRFQRPHRLQLFPGKVGQLRHVLLSLPPKPGERFPLFLGDMPVLHGVRQQRLH